ncbi:MAG: hypothetical protein COX29_03885 [Candidatus Moranbacteria bacterium CG23_combo_of_CG06-09_8_20_14_all_35_22]|nr:MAG: hypothetical protein COX29_03885 [Candidatus Moranbacteria bacterium CG23_combo_of_CG06-09_8_20_14_all_35_22]
MKKKAIVVDDEPSNLKLTITFLKMLGFEVFEFSNPLDVMDVIESINPRVDLLVTDFDMPQMNGAKLIKKIKEKKPKIQTICVSGLDNKAVCDSNGCNIFLMKPLRFKFFKEAVEFLFPPLE